MKTKSAKPKLRRGQSVSFWWSASYVTTVQFVRWCRARMNTGREDSNKLGVGAIVKSDWLFNKTIVGKPPHGLKRGYYRLRPYTDIFRNERDAHMHKRAIKRPELKDIPKP